MKRPPLRTTLARLKPRIIATACWTVCLWSPVVALADDVVRDARQVGYPGGVDLPESSGHGIGLTWLVFVLMIIVCIGVMFKSARRTHLD